MVLNACYQVMQHEDVSVTPQQKKCAPQMTVTKCDGITSKHFRNDESQTLYFLTNKIHMIHVFMIEMIKIMNHMNQIDEHHDSYDSYHVHSRDF